MDYNPIRRVVLVGERSGGCEGEGIPTLELPEVKMQTQVAIKSVKFRLAVNPRFPGEGSSAQG